MSASQYSAPFPATTSRHPLCADDALAEGEAKGFEIGDLSLFIVRKFGAVYAYVNSCPHAGIALEWLPDRFLDIDSELIQCSTHGALFAIDTGVCLAGPCVGDALQPLPVVLHDGMLCVDLSSSVIATG